MSALQTRKQLEALIEQAIETLDRLDGDLDLEDGHDHEPSLCGITAGWGPFNCGNLEDREDDIGDAREGNDDDKEPSLGSPELHYWCDTQEDWAVGGRKDLEHDDCDDEPNLGSGNPMPHTNQSSWTHGCAVTARADEREVDSEAEPWLGWTVDGVFGGTDDIELCEAPL